MIRMKKFEIWFGKDNEYPDWSDNAEKTQVFLKSQVAGRFSTNDEDLFWNTYLSLRLMPPTMWHWLFIDGVQYISGAIDPDDIEYLIEAEIVPDWVIEHKDDFSLQRNDETDYE